MPKFNEVSDIAAGVDQYVSINGLIIKQNAQRPAWKNVNEIIYQANAFSGVPFIELYNKVTHAYTPYLNSGGTQIAAWNNTGFIFLQSSPTHVTIVNPDGTKQSLTDAGQGDVGKDGTVRYNSDYHIANNPYSVWDWNNWIWLAGGKLYGNWQTEPLLTLKDVFTPKLLIVNGVKWLLYCGQHDMVMHPVGELLGYRYNSTPDQYYNPDMIQGGENIINICYSLTAGERITDIRSIKQDLTAPRINLGNPPVANDYPINNYDELMSFLTRKCK